MWLGDIINWVFVSMLGASSISKTQNCILMEYGYAKNLDIVP